MPIDATRLLALEAVAAACFVSTEAYTNPAGTLYGGQLIGQGLFAAMQTTAGWPANSLHASFLGRTNASLPVEYRVEVLRDGRQFALREVRAFQTERLVFRMACSFHAPEPGYTHQAVTMPEVPPPEDLPTLAELARRHGAEMPAMARRTFQSDLPVDLRQIDPADGLFQRNARASRDLWVRIPSATTSDPLRQQCLLAACSDFWLVGVAAIPHRFPTNADDFLLMSLDHAMWFHRAGRCDNWLLYQTASDSAQDGRGFARGLLFDRSGRLLASTAQDGLMRMQGQRGPATGAEQ